MSHKVAERLNFNEIPEKFGIDDQSSAGHPQAKFRDLHCKIAVVKRKSVVKHSKETSILHNFVNLSTVFCA